MVSYYMHCLRCGVQCVVSENSPHICAPDNNPLWVRLLQRLSKPEDIGLGATAKRIAAKVGGDRFKKWAAKIRLPCGCTDREQEWNRLYPNPRYKS